MKKFVITLICLGLSGCAAFTPPRERPLLTESFDTNSDVKASFVMAATDANRRVAIIDILNGQICVEPPPEAANTISEAFTALLEADVPDKGNLGASLSQSISQNINQLYRRTQTVQLYRDAVFALCQSAINGSIVVDDGTKATVPADVREKIATQISKLENKELYDEQIKELMNKGLFDLKTLDAIHIRSNELTQANKDDEAKELTELKNSLSADLKRAEFRRRLEDGLKEAFEILKTELPLFYDTEKLRFLVELGKPIQVCNTETTYEPQEGDAKSKKIEKVTCEAKIPENIDKVVNEYVKALSPKSATETNK